MNEFGEMFEGVTGHTPYPFQHRFATAQSLYDLVDVPTGLGKTAMAVLGWLWRRRFAPEAVRENTPRRLVYCLPMRVLVEQTRDNAKGWLEKLDILAGQQGETGKIAVSVLMGGEDADDWDIYPEADAIIIGTQDMLLSSALNRGYAASRARWPIQFGLLNTDCLWIFDEIQLMGSGLATTAQLEAFRRLLPRSESETAKIGHGCHSVWMSATMRPDWLKTVDFKERVGNLARLSLNDIDHENTDIKQRWTAPKTASRLAGDDTALSKEICKAHKRGTRTIVVLNTVKRACELFGKIKKQSISATGNGEQPKFILLHSRFRPEDRSKAVQDALADPPPTGTIIVSTQVIEAGVDISATTLFTELAPWASMVQRFGRCNRKGELKDGAGVHWIGLPSKEADAENFARPYKLDDLKASAQILEKLNEVGLGSLPDVKLPFEHTHVIRRRDIIDLFDTTPDLVGNDIDIDRFVRNVDETDVKVFWREFEGDPNGTESESAQSAPVRGELCAAPICDFPEFVKKNADKVWQWNFLDNKWQRAGQDKIYPGQIYLVPSDTGGYTPELGWDPNGKQPVQPIEQMGTLPPEANDDEKLSQVNIWQRIDEHTNEVYAQIASIIRDIKPAESDALQLAARWHDWGKTHAIFQNAIDDGQTIQKKGKQVIRLSRPDEFCGCRVIAKAPGKRWRPYNWPEGGRKHFRHELASALAVLQPGVAIPDDLRDLVAYLIAAHHGKVRLSIRSLPGEKRPPDNLIPHRDQRFARGIWDGDKLPKTDLGGDIHTPEVTLSLEPMELGLCKIEPFRDQPSWMERMLRLRDTIGPFRLAYLEALLRAADMRASGIKAKPANQEVGRVVSV